MMNGGKNQPQQIYMNIVLSVALTLCVEASRGLWIPSITHSNYAAGGTKFTLAALISFKSLGRMISFMWMGHFSQRFSVKTCYQISCFLNGLGAVGFAYAYMSSNIWLMIVSRTVTGLGGGVLAPIRAYVSKVTSTDERFFYMGLLTAAQYFGFTICPIMALSFSLFSLPGSRLVSEDTAPAWILLVCSAALYMVITVAFHEEEDRSEYEPISDARASRSSLQASANKPHIPDADAVTDDEEDEGDVEQGRRGLIQDESAQLVVTLGIILYMYLNFTSRGVISTAETVGTTTFKVLYNLQPEELISASAWFYGKAGVLGYGVFIFMLACCKRLVRESSMLIFSFVTLTLGMACLVYSTTTLSTPAFDLGFMLTWSIGFPIKQTCLMSSFSKLLGNRPQGVMQGYIGTFGAAGRIIFPFLSSATSLNVIFGINMVMCFFAMVGLVMYVRFADAHPSSLLERPKEEVMQRRVVQITNRWAARKQQHSGYAVAGVADVMSSDTGGGDRLLVARAKAYADGQRHLSGYGSSGAGVGGLDGHMSDGGAGYRSSSNHDFAQAFEQAKAQIQRSKRR